MTDIRINGFPSASAIADDDFMAVDSATSGTRKYPVNKLIAAAAAAQSPVLDDWSQAAVYIHAGLGPVYFPVGVQAVLNWSTYAGPSSAKSEYEMPLDAVHHGTGRLASGDEMPVVFFQSHYCLPFDTMFSNYQAFLYAIDGLPAGTYHFTMGTSWGSNVVSGKSYEFTLASDLPAGGQLAGLYGAPDQNPANWRVYAFASQTATQATETVALSEGTGGADLGTFTFAGAQPVPASGTPATSSTVTVGGTDYSFYGLNSLQRVAYGNNRWLHSAIRQYLNKSGYDWWIPMTVFDRPPSYASRIGFLSGFDEGFLAHVRPIERKTAINYVTDGGTSAAPEYDTTYDMFALPSGIEHFIADNSTYGGGQGQEGYQWDYWKAVLGSQTPAAWYSTYPQYKQYDLSAHTASRGVWLRSANRSSGAHVASVHSSGYCSGNTAVSGSRAAPACAIG